MNLTQQEGVVYALVISGYTNRQIAERLGISHQTVRHHVSHIFRKKGVSRRIELIHQYVKTEGQTLTQD